MSFWDRFRGKPPPAPTTERPTPTWIAASDNRFGIPILDLVPAVAGLTSFSKDPEQARKAMSWGAGIGDELFGELTATETIDCELRYPTDDPLPDGLVFCPAAMEDKWVFALRDDTLRVARSWTGDVAMEARASRGDRRLTIHQLRFTDASPLRTFGEPVAVFDWMLRTHAFQQLLPLPVDDDGAALLEATPLIAFSTFGNKALCAAKTWSPPPAPHPLRSDGAALVATRHSDLPRLRELAAAGHPIDAPSTFQGYTPLLVAAAKAEHALVEQLLQLGADPNRPADGGALPLLVAFVHDAELRTLQTLVEHGADPKAVNDDGFGALHAVAETDRIDPLAWFLELGLDLELRTNRGHTPLQIAAALGHTNALNALAQAGADLTATSPDGTARDIALAQNKPESVALLDRLMPS